MDSLRTKSKNFFTAADPAFKNVTKKDKVDQDTANMATFAAAAYHTYHEMTADGAFVPEATKVCPYLQCLINKNATPDVKAQAYF